MRTGRFALIALMVVVLDATVAPRIAILGVQPDFLVLAVVYGSLLVGGRPAMIAGFLMGLVADSELPEYFGLNAVGTCIWELIADGATRAELLERVLEQFDVERLTAERDLDELLTSLADRQLIETEDD